MTWFYSQSSGILRHEDEEETTARGYAGNGECKNRPEKQHIHNQGPIPRGQYQILKPRDSADCGPYVLPLRPHPENTMHGRGGFLIHGDSKAAPGTASEGCIILDRKTRTAIWESGDHDLDVTE